MYIDKNKGFGGFKRGRPGTNISQSVVLIPSRTVIDLYSQEASPKASKSTPPGYQTHSELEIFFVRMLGLVSRLIVDVDVGPLNIGQAFQLAL